KMVVMEMHWPEVTPQQYDEVKRRVDWVGNPHGAGQIHIAWFEGGALRCYDVWDSEAAFNDFAQNRLMPVIHEIGIQTEPDAKFHQAHDTFVHPHAMAGV